MDKVWVVEQGEYSDYHVVGVFSSQQNAEMAAAFVTARNEYRPATVAEWPIDPSIADVNAGRSQFEVSMGRDGTVSECEPVIDLYKAVWQNTVELWGMGSYLHAVVWATDADHAVKIVNERRGQMIARGEGPSESIESL
jgi:hypothetical protein